VRPGVVPVVAFHQVHEQKLGNPYSRCMVNDGHHLRYYRNYTYMHCVTECLAIAMEDNCRCIISAMPNYNLTSTRSCSLFDYADCVAPLIKSFTYNTKCDCEFPCSANRPQSGMVQYSKYKYSEALARNRKLISNFEFESPGHMNVKWWSY